MTQKEIAIALPRVSSPIYEERHLAKALRKALESTDGISGKQASEGLKQHPFKFSSVIQFKNANIHHSTCIETKVSSTVGLGFEKDATEEKLDPLCEISTQDLLNESTEDFVQTGNGFIEVKRANGKQIVGLHHLPCADCHIVVEMQGRNMHYEINGGKEGGNTLKWAKFGDLEGFLSRKDTIQGVDVENISEVIHFRRSSSADPWYGFPDWISAVASIELVQCLHQHNFDFFLNRGVPEFLLFFTGTKIDDVSWEQLTEKLKAHIGLGNSHKSSAFNLGTEIEITLHKLGLESQNDGTQFSTMIDTLGMNIVSAHRVPPLLAGIQISGKLGATNELANALMAFQVLCIGPYQKTISTTLNNTLGNPKISDLKLGRGAFNFKKITEVINLQEMDTVGRMRTEAATGRDPAKGLRKELSPEAREALDMLLEAIIAKSKNGTGSDPRV